MQSVADQVKLIWRTSSDARHVPLGERMTFVAEDETGPVPVTADSSYLAGCSRCGMLHGNGTEPRRDGCR